MEQISLGYGLPKETIEAIMTLYKNAKVKVCSSDGKTDFFGIVADVLQGDTLLPIPVHNLPRLRASNVDRFKERMVLLLKRQEADNTSHNQFQMRTTLMI